jgi:hypothetical protein
MRIFAIALGGVAWLAPALAQLWMWLRFSPGAPSLGLLWMVVTLGSVLPACALSILGAWLWHRAGRAGNVRPRAQRVGLVLIATPACVVALLVVCAVAARVIERLQA